SGRAPDQDVAAVAGLQCRLSGAADQDISPLPADEPVRAAATNENIIGGDGIGVAAGAGEIQDVIAAPGEEHHRHTDVGQRAIDGLRGRLDDVGASLAVDDDAADGEEAAVVDIVHADFDTVDRAVVHDHDGRR